MRKFKKWSSIILAALLCGTVLLTGCDTNEDPKKGSSDGTQQTTEEPTNGTTGNNEIPTEQPTEQPTEPADPCAKGHTEVIDAAVDPTCTEKGKTQGKHCSVCGEVLVVQNDVDALGHTEVIDAAVGPTCTEKGKTEGKHCQTCGAILIAQTTLPVTGHGFGEWSIIKEPTETTKGEIRRDCAECGHFEITVVAELSHDHSRYESILLESVTPTCTATGLTVGIKCSGCGELLISQQIIPAKGHDYKSTVTAPTCTAKGYTTYTCHCGDTYTADETKALGHTEVIDDAVAATCTQTGKTEGAHCSVCKEVLIAQSIIPAKGHTYQYVVNSPTATANGSKIGTCYCGDTHTEVIVPVPFEITSSNFEKIGYTGEKGENLVIPSVFEDNGTWYRVTSIGYKAFYNCSSLMSVTIPDSVTSIGNNAFYNCSGLTRVTIPNSVTSIGYNAFYNCGDLTSITIPNSVKTIGNNAFENCDSLTSVTVPDSVTSIGWYAFYGCSSLETITLPFVGNTKDGTDKTNFGYIFGASGCAQNLSYVPTSLKHVVITGGTSIDEYAFWYCTDLTSIVLGESVTSINEWAFYGCSGLKSIILEDRVTSIGRGAFDYLFSTGSIYYTGTAEDWESICIDSWNEGLFNATCYYYSKTKPTTSGNYWRYVDGMPTAWE